MENGKQTEAVREYYSAEKTAKVLNEVMKDLEGAQTVFAYESTPGKKTYGMVNRESTLVMVHPDGDAFAWLGRNSIPDAREIVERWAGIGNPVMTITPEEMIRNVKNEIGKLYNGETVCPAGTGYNGYLYVYSPKLNMYGYVNARYVSSYTPSPVPAPNYCPGYSCTVTGTTHYLALRSAAAYDERNEIGRLYNGQTVEYINSGNGNYVYVYAPTLNAYGYVNRNYLCPFV